MRIVIARPAAAIGHEGRRERAYPLLHDTEELGLQGAGEATEYGYDDNDCEAHVGQWWSAAAS